MSPTDAPASTSRSTSYPLSTKLTITFSVYEDRLVVQPSTRQNETTVLLLSRRMVIIVLQELLAKLPGLSGLNQTPAEYWQEVLRMAHQQAMHQRQLSEEGRANIGGTAAASEAPKAPAAADAGRGARKAQARSIYLATELKVKVDDKVLTLAFNGLPMPQAMTIASAPQPVFAVPLQLTHVHQLIQLLITKAEEAYWHLPLDLPWLENPRTAGTSLGTPPLH